MAQYPAEQWSDKDKTPRHIPWNPIGWVKPSYHKNKGWVPPDLRREENKKKRRLERDPNHPSFSQRYGLLKWHSIRINLIGSDEQGRQVISIRKGDSEPIYIRFGTNQIELFRAGKKINWN